MRVRALKDHVQRLVRHPRAGGFPSTGGDVEWPNDAFTRRRIRDGDVEVVEDQAKATDRQEAARQEGTRRSYRREQTTGEQSN